ncbi:hypothetical protein VTO73DRAFT_4476 [Trametes versicolor]
MSPIPPIHQVYSEQLFPLRHGFPLWDAEPEDQKFEVEIGTVGYIKFGKFWNLFNAMKPKEDPYQKMGVPNQYTPFKTPANTLRGPWEKIKFPLVVSQTVRNRDIGAALQAGSPDGSVSIGGSLNFDCRENTGAFLLLERPVKALFLSAKRFIVQYMRDNLNHWIEFANTTNGLSLLPEEIYFVHGTVKTSKWAAGAFHGNSRSRKSTVQAQVMEVVNFGLSISITTEDNTRMDYSYGPTGHDLGGSSRPRTAIADSSISGVDAGDPDKCNQCVFINYYKAKKRFMLGPTPMEAAAGPHRLPSPDRSDPMDGTLVNESQWCNGPVPRAGRGHEDFEPDTAPEPLCDPVNSLLDYILEHSEASIAVACDTDIYVLFRDCEYPSNLAVALKWMKPIIQVDEYGCGTVAVDMDVDSQIPPVYDMTQSSFPKRTIVSRDVDSDYTSAGDQIPKPETSKCFPPTVKHQQRKPTLLQCPHDTEQLYATIPGRAVETDDRDCESWIIPQRAWTSGSPLPSTVLVAPTVMNILVSDVLDRGRLEQIRREYSDPAFPDPEEQRRGTKFTVRILFKDLDDDVNMPLYNKYRSTEG